MQSSGMPWPGDEGAERWEQAWMAIKKVSLYIKAPIFTRSLEPLSSFVNYRDSFTIDLHMPKCLSFCIF